MAPYSERVAEPFDLTPLSQDLPGGPGPPRGDTPSPRTPSTEGSASPPPFEVVIPEPRPLVPLLSTGDGLPYDHTLPEYIRHVSGQLSFDHIQIMTLRVLTETASLQQMSFYTPNLLELNLEGSALFSLRDIGCEMKFLQVLRVSRCRLTSLDGTLGLTSLRELHAAGNHITSAAPCGHLSKLQALDLSRNQVQDTRSLGFLSLCKDLRSLQLIGNPVSHQEGLRNFIRTTLPTLQMFDHEQLIVRGRRSIDWNGRREDDTSPSPALSPRTFEKEDSTDSSSSRVSSAGSHAAASRLFSDSDTEAGVETVDVDIPGPSTQGSISRLTSGRILCGNLSLFRGKQANRTATQQHAIAMDAVEASQRWRAAYHKFRELNAARWAKENAEDDSSESGCGATTVARSLENEAAAKADDEEEDEDEEM